MSKYIDIINEGTVHNLKTIYSQNYVDTVQVVRCKDCKKWFRHTKVDRERGECRRYETTKHETGFCDRGERKDNESKAD